jgi:hypothetical protein
MIIYPLDDGQRGNEFV